MLSAERFGAEGLLVIAFVIGWTQSREDPGSVDGCRFCSALEN
jgi:hypothetical protein